MARGREAPNPLLAELRSVHGMLRRDLATCRTLAAAAANGAPAAQLRAGVNQLKTRGPLFQLRAHCIQHCHAVHGHHEGEDTGLFRTIGRTAPHMKSTLDKLRADHRVVSDLLDQVEGAARGLENSAASRTRLVDALAELSTVLLAHLEFEERELGPVLLSMNTRPTRR